MFYIHQAMHESILPRVAATIIAKQAWDTLETSYQGLDKVKTSKLQILRRDFESLSMKDIESVDSLYTRVVGLINQLKSNGENIEYQRVVEKILRSLPPRFESLVVTWILGCDLGRKQRYVDFYHWWATIFTHQSWTQNQQNKHIFGRCIRNTVICKPW